MEAKNITFTMNILTRVILISFLITPQNDNFGQADKMPKIFNLVFSDASFTHVNEMDAKASLNIYVGKYKTGWEKESGKTMELKIITISEENTIEKIVASGVPSIFQISSIEYVEYEKLFNSRPYVVGVTGPKVLEEFVLLVRKESGIKSIRELKNKKVASIGGISGLVAKMWLDTKILRLSNQNSEEYFKNIELVESPSKAMLSLFFKNSDACVINDYSFDILCEMNPQMNKGIIVIDQSEGLLPGLSVLVNSTDKPFNNYIDRFALNLPSEEHSKQMLVLFRIDDIIPFEEKYLDNVRKLLDDHKTLTKKMRSIK